VLLVDRCRAFRNTKDPALIHFVSELHSVTANSPYSQQGEVVLVSHGGPKGAIINFVTNDSQEEVARYFSDRFEQSGWLFAESSSGPEPRFWFCRNGEELSFSTRRLEPKTSIAVSIGERPTAMCNNSGNRRL
jgi:hypothetical protein